MGTTNLPYVSGPDLSAHGRPGSCCLCRDALCLMEGGNPDVIRRATRVGLDAGLSDNCHR